MRREVDPSKTQRCIGRCRRELPMTIENFRMNVHGLESTCRWCRNKKVPNPKARVDKHEPGIIRRVIYHNEVVNGRQVRVREVI